MWKTMMMLIALALVAGCAYTPEQEDSVQRFNENLSRAVRDLNLSNQGYDMKCIQSIRGMENEGTISPAQANYLIEKECKDKPIQEPQRIRNPFECPICGLLGREISGPRSRFRTYRCVNEHIWQSE
jgi:hypothetical protein